MFEIKREEIQWGGKILSLETGKIARQADGSVWVKYGETIVLCNVVIGKKPKEGIDFLPLSVHYKEMGFAANKIPGGFTKREGAPSQREILISRLIDRPIRPLFPSNLFNEMQVICTVLAYDGENDPDIVAMIGASAALSISGAPFDGPIAGARVGLIDEKFVLNPTAEEMKKSNLDLVLGATRDSILMVESEANILTESKMLEALSFGHQSVVPVIDLIKNFANNVNKSQLIVEDVLGVSDETLREKINSLGKKDIESAFQIKAKQDRNNQRELIKQNIVTKLTEEGYEELVINYFIKELEKDIVRNKILNQGIRIDNRDHKTIRPIQCEVGILPNSHGSSLFTRGETQALAVTTLGTAEDKLMVDSLGSDFREHFMLHYNFPSYSVGEIGMMRAPGRREIGHGKLAWRALHPVLPNPEEFNYTVRTVVEITECNGSSSMATVCSSSLAMMDAGIPMKAAVAGIAMGLVKSEDKYVILSDIMGDEDALGDMDFKVAGTKEGITSLQMDIKINGITLEIMNDALLQAKEGRLFILDKMAEALAEPRDSVSDKAPVMTTITVPKDKIREVIGSGGKVIREICELTGAKLDIKDDGTITIAASTPSASNAAIDMINNIVFEPQIGIIYDALVIKLMDFGVIVSFNGTKKEGMVHISELADFQVDSIKDVVSEGASVKVKVLGIDMKGKIKLSMRVVNQETGEDITEFVSKRNSAPTEGRRFSSDRNSNYNKTPREDGFNKKINSKRKYFS